MRITLLSKTSLCALAAGFIIASSYTTPAAAQDVIVTDEVVTDTVIVPAPVEIADQEETPAIEEEKVTSTPIDIPPSNSAQTHSPVYNDAYDTHPPLKISPDKSELVRLEKDAGSIIVGSPSHLSVLADSARTLVLVPQVPGATYVTILDKQGNVLMQRHVIIGSPKKKYVRIRKSCAGESDCQATQVYYCPDMCHKVNVAQEATESTSSGNDSASSGGGGAPAPLPVIQEPPAE